MYFSFYCIYGVYIYCNNHVIQALETLKNKLFSEVVLKGRGMEQCHSQDTALMYQIQRFFFSLDFYFVSFAYFCLDKSSKRQLSNVASDWIKKTRERLSPVSSVDFSLHHRAFSQTAAYNVALCKCQHVWALSVQTLMTSPVWSLIKSSSTFLFVEKMKDGDF